MKRSLRSICVIILILSILGPINSEAWSNGGYSEDPTNPKYGTHDWIAEHALDWLPKSEKQYILDNLNQYLFATEYPDYPVGYGDTFNHHIYYRSNGDLQENDSAVRAEEEYNKALKALKKFDYVNARYFTGALTHYIADVAVFGHVMGPDTDWGTEIHHSDFEKYINHRTSEFDQGYFEKYLWFDGDLENISAYQAALNLASDTTFDIDGDLDCMWMDAEAGKNHAPIILSISADPNRVQPGDSSTINVVASDDDDEYITYDYSTTGGTISGSGSLVTWTAPDSVGSYSITVEASDGELTDTKTVSVSVEMEHGQTAHLMINEFEQDPDGSDAGNEWIELYNPTIETINLTGWVLCVPDSKDADHPLSGTISPSGFKVITFTKQWLDNNDEWISLIDCSGSTIDKTPKKNDTENDDFTWQRYPNGRDSGSSSDWEFRPSTKGSSNGEMRSITRGNTRKDSAYVNRVGESLNYAVNLIADVLHHLAWESGYVDYYRDYQYRPFEILVNVTEGYAPLSVAFTINIPPEDWNEIGVSWYFTNPGIPIYGEVVNYTFYDPGVHTVAAFITIWENVIIQINITVFGDKNDDVIDDTPNNNDFESKQLPGFWPFLCCSSLILIAIAIVVFYVIGRYEKKKNKAISDD